jgi:hypothetical protein
LPIRRRLMPFYTTGYNTTSAGTEITSICPPNGDMIPVVRGFKYRNGASGHKLYFCSPLGVTRTIEFTDASGTTLELARNDPGRATDGTTIALAAGDWIAYRTRSGALEARKIASITGTTVTITATGEEVEVGAEVWAFYGYLDIHASESFDVAASDTVSYDNLHIQCGVPAQRGKDAPVSGSGMPMLVWSDNVTNAGKLDYVQYEWVPASEDFIS